MKHTINLFLFILLLYLNLYSQTPIYYVDPISGNDNNSGTLDKPFLTLTKAVAVLTSNASGTLYLRTGTYNLSANLRPNKNGSVAGYFNLWAYPGEKPVLDFSTEPFGARGLYLSVNYWHVKGLEIKNSGDNGVYISGSYNIIENCTIHDNQDTGLQIDGGGHDNKIINCDSYYNADPGQGNADGFSPKLGVGTGNYFFGCRAWQNSDDGWDGYLRTTNDVTTTLEYCWSFKNGYLKDGSASQGNGNGFKMGGSDNKDLMHNVILKNCLSFDNRVKGFDQNNNRGSMTLYNCTAFRDGTYNFSIPSNLNAGKIASIKNSVSFMQTINILFSADQQNNTWLPQFTVASSDFISIDPSAAYGPRKADGSLPEIPFMHLVSGSKLIDAGVYVGIPFTGNAPDLGAFEYNTQIPTDVRNNNEIPISFVLFQNYPNPFNPETIISWQLEESSHVTLRIFDMLGRIIVTLVDEYQLQGIHSSTLSSQHFFMPSGVYFYKLTAGNYSATKKMVLIR